MIKVFGFQPDGRIGPIFVNTIVEAMLVAAWGTFGKDGKEPLIYKRLIDCDDEHLQNILRTQPHLDILDYDVIIKEILKDREI